MLPVQRHDATLALLSRHRVLSVEELASHLHVSLSTIRHDLDELERQGSVHRVHGGAVLRGRGVGPDDDRLRPALHEVVLHEAALHQVARREEKLAIARSAVDLVAPGSSVLLTGGTTTAALAPLLGGVPDISIVTSSLDIAMRLVDVDVDLVLLGGSLRRPGLSLEEVHVDHAIMGVYGIDSRSGLLGGSETECETDRRLAHSADRLTVLADASKFDRRSAHRICGRRRRLRARHLAGSAGVRPREPSAAGPRRAPCVTLDHQTSRPPRRFRRSRDRAAHTVHTVHPWHTRRSRRQGRA